MEEQRIRPGEGSRWPIFLLLLICAAMAVVAVWCIFFGYNRFYLELECEPQLLVEYGEPVPEPGCRVFLKGTVFWQEGWELELPVEVLGRVNPAKAGKNVLEYRADYYGLQASAVQEVRIVDTQPPVIRLVPDPQGLAPAEIYQEAGFTAIDNLDGDITDQVIRTEEEGKVTYRVVDSSGNLTCVERVIPIFDFGPPQITLLGGDTVTILLGTPYQEPGFTAYDRRDGDVTAKVTAQLEQERMMPYQPGSYTIRYSVTDSDGNEAEAIRTVIVEAYKRPSISYPQGKVIYLTFDDGPGPDTPRLLELLRRYHVQATFFVVDTGHPEILRQIIQDGHNLGIHTKSHNYQQIYAGVDEYFADLLGMQEIICQATGIETWLVRFPGGSSNTISRFNTGIMTTLTQVVEDMGFSYFDWNVDSDDAGKAHTSAQVFANVKQGVLQNTRSVVLMHDIHSYSVDAVESILVWGLNNGYTFLPLQTDSPPVHHGVKN